MMATLYSGGSWLEGATQESFVNAGQHFLQASARLALLSFQLKEERFPITPKHHSLFHIVQISRYERDISGRAMNPVTESCAQDEDFVGRLARICRSVSPRATGLRTLQRYLFQCREVWFKP